MDLGFLTDTANQILGAADAASSVANTVSPAVGPGLISAPTLPAGSTKPNLPGQAPAFGFGSIYDSLVPTGINYGPGGAVNSKGTGYNPGTGTVTPSVAPSMESSIGFSGGSVLFLLAAAGAAVFFLMKG